MPAFPFPTTPSEFITWLGLPGVAGVIIAVLLERNAKFRAWKSPWKGRLVLALFLLLPVLARLAALAVAALDPATLKQVESVVSLLMSGLIAYSSSQYAHTNDDAGPLDVK
jgi:hypothetical protein